MRASIKEVTVTQMVQTTATNEDIDHYIVTANSVAVHVKYMGSEGQLLSSETFEIIGDNFELLMSSNPEFAPGKPENEFRRSDLWHFVDLLRS